MVQLQMVGGVHPVDGHNWGRSSACATRSGVATRTKSCIWSATRASTVTRRHSAPGTLERVEGRRRWPATPSALLAARRTSVRAFALRRFEARAGDCKGTGQV